MYKDINVNVSGPQQPASIYKTLVLKGQSPFASQVTEPNMKYVIKHNFVLNGNVTIPANCILEFDGGSISGGGNTLNLNSCVILADDYYNCFIDCTISGKLKNNFVSVCWFGAKGDAINDDTSSFNNAANSTRMNSTLYIPNANSSYLITGTVTTRDINVVGAGGPKVVGILASGNFIAFDVYGAGITIENINVAFDNAGSSSIGFQFNGFTKSKATKLRVRYAYIGFNLGDVENEVSWGSLFELCSADLVSNYGFFFYSQIGTTTLSFIKCDVTGNNSTYKPQGYYFQNITDLDIVSCNCNTINGMGLRFLEIEHLYVRCYRSEDCSFENDINHIDVLNVKNYFFEDIALYRPNIVSNGGRFLSHRNSCGTINISKSLCEIVEQNTGLILIRFNPLPTETDNINIVTAAKPISIINLSDLGGHDALIKYNGDRYVKGLAWLDDIPVPQYEKVYLTTPVADNNKLIIGYYKISSNTTAVIGTDYIPITIEN